MNLKGLDFNLFSLEISLLIIISVVTNATASIMRGEYTKRYPMSGKYLWSFQTIQNLFCFLAVAAIYALSGVEIFKFSPFSIGLGLLFAIANILNIESTLKAQSCGSFAYTMTIVSLSTLLPTLSGAAFFGEKITWSQYIGILLMIVCILLFPSKSDGDNKSVNLKWVLFCTLAFFAAGLTGIIQKVHQSNEAHKSEMSVLLLTCFLVSFLFSLFKLLSEASSDKKAENNREALPSKSFVIAGVSGLCFAFPNAINLFLSGKMVAAVFFPTVNLCPMLITMLYAVFVLREKLTAKQWSGIAVGILSTVFLSGAIG